MLWEPKRDPNTCKYGKYFQFITNFDTETRKIAKNDKFLKFWVIYGEKWPKIEGIGENLGVFGQNRPAFGRPRDNPRQPFRWWTMPAKGQFHGVNPRQNPKKKRKKKTEKNREKTLSGENRKKTLKKGEKNGKNTAFFYPPPA